MRFGLTANIRRVGAREAIDACLAWAEKSGHTIVLSDTLDDMVSGAVELVPDDTLASKVDILISMGGDGTMLASARLVRDRGTPILGINLGSLGFLTQQTPQQLVAAMESIVAGRHRIEERMLLEVRIDGRTLPEPFALNDVVLSHGPISRLLDISLKVNGERVVVYKADGLIIATPTGSTAYNLAVGGPIIHPTMDAMIAAPISPFSLTTRPMIVRAEDELEMEILSGSEEANLTLDGQVMENLQDGERVHITRAGFRLKFVVFPESSFYELLRTKLNWGVPPNFNA